MRSGHDGMSMRSLVRNIIRLLAWIGLLSSSLLACGNIDSIVVTPQDLALEGLPQKIQPVPLGTAPCSVLVMPLFDDRPMTTLRTAPWALLIPGMPGRGFESDRSGDEPLLSGVDEIPRALSLRVLDAVRRFSPCRVVEWAGERGARPAPASERQVDYIVGGSVKRTHTEGFVISYGLSLLDLIPWLLGAPVERDTYQTDLALVLTRSDGRRWDVDIARSDRRWYWLYSGLEPLPFLKVSGAIDAFVREDIVWPIPPAAGANRR